MSRIDKFIAFVREWCEDDSHGYSQINRWGPNDCDCSSLMYMAANHAGYDVPTGWGNTQTMYDHFTAAGWTAVAFDGNLYDCQPGCIILNTGCHTEAFVDWGVFGGAHIDENGDIVGATPGDQTGNEVSICNAYIYSNGWDYVLIPPDEETGDTEDSSGQCEDSNEQPRYRVQTRESGWLPDMLGKTDTGGSSDDFAGEIGCWAYGVDIEGGNFELTLQGGEVLPRGATNENGEKAVIGVTVFDDVYYQVHSTGNGWLKVEHAADDNGAGDDVYPIDALRMWR